MAGSGGISWGSLRARLAVFNALHYMTGVAVDGVGFANEGQNAGESIPAVQRRSRGGRPRVAYRRDEGAAAEL